MSSNLGLIKRSKRPYTAVLRPNFCCANRRHCTFMSCIFQRDIARLNNTSVVSNCRSRASPARWRWFFRSIWRTIGFLAYLNAGTWSGSLRAPKASIIPEAAETSKHGIHNNVAPFRIRTKGSKVVVRKRDPLICEAAFPQCLRPPYCISWLLSTNRIGIEHVH